MSPKQLCLISSLGISICCLVNPINAQIVPDNTTKTSTLDDCQSSCNITGGQVAGQNLFHSFAEFNVGVGEKVYFSDPGVNNIFSRVTGSNLSNIFGTLGVSGGDANLFLLNPNGIVFGAGAALDVAGSFLATTADEIQFGDRNFSAIPNPQENLALLTVNPTALFFNQMGQNGSIVLNNADLALSPGQDLILLGHQNKDLSGITLQDSSINTSQGNITLGAIRGEGKIALDPDLKIDFATDIIPGDISLDRGSSVKIADANNGSIYFKGDSIALAKVSEIAITNSSNFDAVEISLEVNNLTVQENSAIYSSTVGAGKSADIKINAQESVRVIGKNNLIFQQFLQQNLQLENNADVSTSIIETSTEGTGSAGDIEINTSNFAIKGGARAISGTFGSGATGNITIDVANTFSINGSGLLTSAAALTTGEVGTLDVNAGELLIEQGGLISSSTLGNGDAGNLKIKALESIEIRDTPPNSLVPTGVFTNTILGNGKAGDLNINTPKLILKNGGQLSASSGAITANGLIPLGGEGGNIIINADKSLEVSGASADGRFSSSILSDTRTANSAGNLTINVGILSLNDKGLISASSVGTGTGGNITVNATDSISLTGNGTNNMQELFTQALMGELELSSVQGGFAAFSIVEGDAGDITITAPKLNLESGTILATAAFGNGNAGNLEITATEEVNIVSSAIASPTFGSGNAGNIDINTKNLDILEGGQIASASIGTGQGGDIFITATESINIVDSVDDLLVSGSISTGSYAGFGFSGDLTINTQRLSIRNGANIQATNTSLIPENLENPTPVSVNNPIDYQGKLTINASESIKISGVTFQENFFNLPLNSYISSRTTTSATASDITINTGKLSLADGGEISVSSLGEGAAGTLKIEADTIALDGTGHLNATTRSGQGGNINLLVEDILTISDRSFINTNATRTGNGGNVEIKASFIVASGNSLITANAQEMGNGGNINVTSKELFLTPDTQITASSALGIDGTVKIETFIHSDRNNFTRLPEQVIKTDNLIVQSCSSNKNQSVFSYVGKGGLPSSPLSEFSSNDAIIPDFDLPPNFFVDNQPKISNITLLQQPKAIVEAQRWKVNHNGKVELVASHQKSSLFPQNNSFGCASK